jgi:ubiquinone/menaquinone biosynthesis C-methylase UbiE
MNVNEASRLLAHAVPADLGGTWADFGAGDGTFTLALATLLGASARVYAVDRDKRALGALERRAVEDGVRNRITPVIADFTMPFEPPGERLDGMLFANSLHFVRNADAVLNRLVQWLRPDARVVFVEYDRRPASRWVPYPVDADRLPAICAAAGLTKPVVTGTRPSDYGGDLYVAFATVAPTA